MDSLADLWIRSGKNNQRLFRGSADEIVKELKAWVNRRKVHNDVSMDTLWNVFGVQDSLNQLRYQLEGTQEGQISAMMNEILANVDRKRRLDEERDRETLLANFFLASLQNRGIRWPQMPRPERFQADASVCAFLGTVGQNFDARLELETLDDSVRIARWEAELRRRDAIRAQEIARDPIPGVNTHSIGLVGARFKQEVTNDPAISSREALTNAARGIMPPGAVDFVMGSNSAGTTSTSVNTGQATRPSDGKAPTTNDTVTHIGDMLGNINTTGPSSSTAAGVSHDMNTAASGSSGNAAATPGIANLAPGAASNTPADNHDNANITAGPASSTATGTGASDQTLRGMEEQDGGSKISKAKKKREGRKRAKAARAKEAIESPGVTVGNDDDEDDGELPDLVDV